MEEREKRENIVAGVVGAFLGSLIGVACVVIIGQLGYVASISGLIMAVCALKGYELLGGTLSRKGAAISMVLILAMTYFAHQLSWAIALAEAMEGELGIWESFRAIPQLLKSGMLERAPYWGDLAMLYLFTLLGAVPTVINGLKNAEAPETPLITSSPAEAAPKSEASFYPGERAWTRPMRFSAALSMVPGLLLGIGVVIAAARMNTPIPVTLAGLGCILSCFVMMFLALSMQQASQAEMFLYVRSAGTLWRVELARLNNLDTYRFTNKIGGALALRWDKLNRDEEERARASIQRAIGLLTSGQVLPGSALSRIVLPLTDFQLVKENDWYWKGTYALRSGKRKKLTIPKAYPDFTPVPGAEPCREPAPFHWKLVAGALALAMLLGAVGYGLGYILEGGGTPSGPAAKRGELKALTPDSAETYEIGGLRYQVDSAFQRTAPDTYQDPDTGTDYALGVQTGMDEASAVESLLQPISDTRMSSSYDHFAFAHVDAEDTLVPLTAADGSIYQYEILTVYFTNGDAVHKGVALLEDGVLVEVLAHQDAGADGDEVKGTILYMLESLEVTGPVQVEITVENYQSLFHLGTELGLEQTAVGYIKAPPEMFGFDAFVDAHVPYSETPEYLEDGAVLRSAAHGMEVEVTITPSRENAAAVVDSIYEELVSSGLDIVGEGVTETFFQEADDIAAKQAAYWEDNGTKPRIAILYADRKQDGFYLSARITYSLEQLDGDYPALLAELSDVYGITLPEVDPVDLP